MCHQWNASSIPSSMKESINDVPEQWDRFKKYTNPYEFIHSRAWNKDSSSEGQALVKIIFQDVRNHQDVRSA